MLKTNHKQMCEKYSIKNNLVSPNRQTKTRYRKRIINVSIIIKFVKQEHAKKNTHKHKLNHQSIKTQKLVLKLNTYISKKTLLPLSTKTLTTTPFCYVLPKATINHPREEVVEKSSCTH